MELSDLLNYDFEAFKEDSLDEIPNGDINDMGDTGSDFSESMSDSEGGDQYGDYGNGYDDGGFDENGEPRANDPFADVDDSEFSLISDLRENYAKLYNNQYISYNKLKSENYESSEYEKEFKVLIDMYKRTLNLLYVYISRKYKDESTTTKIMTFVEFKEKFVSITDECNRLIDLINQKHTKERDDIF